MNNDTLLKIQAYLDNELSPAEARKIANLISVNSDAHTLYAELRETKEILLECEPELKLEESRDFYWSKIRRAIETAEIEPVVRPAFKWWVKILAPMAGALALFALLLSITHPAPDAPVAQNFLNEAKPLHEIEDLSPDVSTITFRSEAEGVTVVWVSSQ